MATIPQTTHFGAGDAVGRFTGVAADTAIPWFPPNPFDLSDVPISNAALLTGCACDYTPPTYLGLDASTDLYNDITMLFHGKPLEQFSPIQVKDKTDDGSCMIAPINGLNNTIHFHTFDNNVVEQHSRMLYDDPSLDHRQIDIRAIPNQPTLLSQRIDVLGYTHIIGDSPGYGKGRQISFESGKIKLGLEKAGDIIQHTQVIPTAESSDSGKYYTVDMPKGIYIRTLVIEYKEGDGKNNAFHIAFKYDVSNTSNCGPDIARYEQILKHETMIDNIGAVGFTPAADKPAGGSPQSVVNQIQSKNPYTVVDCRFSTADYIEIWGFNGTPTKVTVHYLNAYQYFRNVVKSDSFCSSFDAQNRMFVFYEDSINFTELPYVKSPCLQPSSSSSVPNLPPPIISPPGGGGVGGNGGGGIPGQSPQPIQYHTPSSSSSSSKTDTTGEVTPPTPPGTVDKTPPPPVRNIGGKVDVGQDGSATVTLNFTDGSTLPGEESQQTGPPGGKNAVSYNIYWSTDPSGPFSLIGTTNTLSFTDLKPIEDTWNYYRVTAVNAGGYESGYVSFELFVVRPKQCEARDCVGCKATGFKSRNGFTVFFSEFPAASLAFQATPCDPNKPSFVRILPEAFYEKNRDINGNKVPVKFCLLPNCKDPNLKQECSWSNTFYVPALVSNCSGYGCLPGFEKVLVPITINLYQRASNGWTLEAYGVGTDCSKLPLFESEPQLPICHQPTRFLNKLDKNFSSASGTYKTARSTSVCAIFPPEQYKQNTGTISVAMSPDYGMTWYQFKGVINIKQDKRAVNPFVSYNKELDTFHLFYVERDYSDENARGQAATQGFDAALCHVQLKAEYFLESDAFKNFYPSPSTSSSTAAVDDYAKSQLFKFSVWGQHLRLQAPQYIIREEHIGNDNSPDKKRISLTEEHNSSYIDNTGKLWIIRNGAAGTLVDPPDLLTRRRRKKAKCGNFSWTVSGITDKDCACQSLLGTFSLELNSKKATYEDSKWSLGVSADYNFWVMSHNDGSLNSMLVFRKKRGLTLCPPEGQYELICNRCAGGIVGTLQSENVTVYGDNTPIANDSNLPAATYNRTDFGQVPFGFNKEQEFIIRNDRRIDLKLTGNPRVSIIGPNASEFSVITNTAPIIPSQGSTTFTIRFTPNRENCVDPKNPTGLRAALVKIQTDDKANTPYQFNIAGRCVPPQNNLPSNLIDHTIIDNFAPGAVFSANAVGSILLSPDNGRTWMNYSEGIKTGEKANALWDNFQNALYNFYIVDDMLFMRRYPALMHTTEGDQNTSLDQPFDGFNIIKDPQILIPNTDVLQNGLPTSLDELIALPTFFDLPVIKIPGDIIDTFEADLRSKKTKLINEKDRGGLPVFLAGNKQGALINAYFPYSSNYIFNDQTAVALAKPASALTRSGAIRFFYVDLKGNVNGGTVQGILPRLDTKLRNK